MYTWDWLAEQTLKQPGLDAQERIRATNLQGNKTLQRALGLASMVNEGVLWFQQVNGRLPGDWTEFVSSPFSPVGSDGVNPLTGGPIYGDGRANDFELVITSEGGWQCFVTDETGNYAWVGDYLD
jgi:hypothetical protein